MVTVDLTELSGFLKLSPRARERILSRLEEEYGTYNKAAEDMGVSRHHFYNYARRDKKLHTSFVNILKRQGLVHHEDFEAFYDDKGSSSTAYTADFPIEYGPSWHFVFSLCLGDGHFHRRTGEFYWHQKEEGVEELAELLQGLGFEYNLEFDSARHGIVLPRLIRKVGEHVLGIRSKEEAFKQIIPASRGLGEKYEVALLTAFFVDEAGMSTAKRASEITVHQEGNLRFLEDYGELLNDFDVEWNRNSKGDAWVIRITSAGVQRLDEIFDRAEELGFGLLHRRKAFNEKAAIASETAQETELRKDTSEVRDRIVSGDVPEPFGTEDIKPLFKTQMNMDRRARELLQYLEERGYIKKSSRGMYFLKS